MECREAVLTQAKGKDFAFWLRGPECVGGDFDMVLKDSASKFTDKPSNTLNLVIIGQVHCDGSNT